MKSAERFFDSELIARLSRLELVAKRIVDGFLARKNKRSRHGFSVEFVEHREYVPGDDLRPLDWKVLGRMDRYYIKRYEEETNTKVYLLLDASGSMDFQSAGPMSKFRYATCLAASLSYLMLRQRDAVGLMLFRDRICSYVPPRSVQSHLHVLLKEMSQVRPQADTGMASAFHDLADRISRRGLVVILSDLLDDVDEVLAGLRHFRHRGHEVIVLQILDSRERDLDFKSRSDTRFVDLEDAEQQLNTQPWHIQSQYREMMDEFLRSCSYRCAEAGIDYTLLDTATPFDLALSRYLVSRKRLG